jgi:predicted nucleic-acid-binding protein
MIGLDTNILVRIFVDEDDVDERRSRSFLLQNSDRDAFFVATIVLVELIWTLRASYQLKRASISAVVRELLDDENFVVECRDEVEQALALHDTAKADFSDGLIAMLCLKGGCNRTVTLDREAAKAIPSMELLA